MEDTVQLLRNGFLGIVAAEQGEAYSEGWLYVRLALLLRVADSAFTRRTSFCGGSAQDRGIELLGEFCDAQSNPQAIPSSFDEVQPSFASFTLAHIRLSLLQSLREFNLRHSGVLARLMKKRKEDFVLPGEG
jgi:hypothetical protein